jgi:hypothetical protein
MKSLAIVIFEDRVSLSHVVMELIHTYNKLSELKECNVLMEIQTNINKFPKTFDEEICMLQKSETPKNCSIVTEATKSRNV